MINVPPADMKSIFTGLNIYYFSVGQFSFSLQPVIQKKKDNSFQIMRSKFHKTRLFENLSCENIYF